MSGFTQKDMDYWKKFRSELNPNEKTTTETYFDTIFGVFTFLYDTTLDRELIWEWEHYAANRLRRIKAEYIGEVTGHRSILFDGGRCKIVRMHEFDFELWYDRNAYIFPRTPDVRYNYIKIGALSVRSEEKVLEALSFMEADSKSQEPIREVKVYKVDYM